MRETEHNVQSTAGGREALIQGLKKVMADSPLTSPSASKTQTIPTGRAIAGVA